MEHRTCPDCGTFNTLASNSRWRCTHCDYQFASDPRADFPSPRKFPTGKLLGLAVLGLGIWFYAPIFRDESNRPQEDVRTERRDSPPIPSKPIAPESLVSIKEWSWSTGGFGAIMMATFTIHNGNAFQVKDIEIACSLSAGSGTKIDSAKKTIYELLPANSEKTFRKINMGFIRDQVKKATCEVASVAQ